MSWHTAITPHCNSDYAASNISIFMFVLKLSWHTAITPHELNSINETRANIPKEYQCCVCITCGNVVTSVTTIVANANYCVMSMPADMRTIT